jgi:hypothetical protein
VLIPAGRFWRPTRLPRLHRRLTLAHPRSPSKPSSLVFAGLLLLRMHLQPTRSRQATLGSFLYETKDCTLDLRGGWYKGPELLSIPSYPCPAVSHVASRDFEDHLAVHVNRSRAA